MNLKTKVSFKIDIDNYSYTFSDTVNADILAEVKKQIITDIVKVKKLQRTPSLVITIRRIINIVDGNKPNVIKSKIKGEKITFYVMDKITYPNQISKFLLKKFHSTLDFAPASQTKPVALKGIETSYNVTRNINDFINTVNIKGKVKYDYLTDKQIVTDKNLNQIWPAKTETMPIAVAELLSKTKERIK